MQQWCDNCDAMLGCIETQVERANLMKESHHEHKTKIEKQVQDMRDQLKAKQQIVEGQEDPDSRMEIDRDRRDKKPAKSKGLRGAGKTSFWQK